MNHDQKLILVTGATGQQGGATTRQLLAKGWPVRTITRDPAKEAARQLVAQGVEVVQADFNDPASLEKALNGVYGVFSVQTFVEGVDIETRQGKALADAALAAQVKHFVYSSVGGADRQSGVPHFESKRAVEQHIEASDLTTTILRPVFFMENFVSFMRPQLVEGKLILQIPLQPTVKLQMIAANDIGVFAAQAFEQPDQYAGQALEIAGDELTPLQIVAAFSRALGQPVEFVEQSIEQLRNFSEENALMFDWFNKHGYQADLVECRKHVPNLQTFEQFATEHRDSWR